AGGEEGDGLFRTDPAPGGGDAVKGALEAGLAGHGFTATPGAQRLASYLAVENTYLSTFQALGGMGLLLGALGLAVVLLRSIWERRGELALFRALGFRERALRWLILAENGFLFVLGLVVGAGAGILSIAPELLSGSGGVPWLRLTLLLFLVLLIGLLSAAIATASALRASLLAALRRE